jgi:hypothetical protein
MNIQHITPEMIKTQPDQTARIINQIIDYINEKTAND